MKRIAVLLIIVMSSMMLVRVATAGPPRNVRLQGTITEVLPAGIILHTVHGDTPIEVSDNTQIFRNGVRALLEELQPGDRARVAAIMITNHDGRRFLAVVIKAHGK